MKPSFSPIDIVSITLCFTAIVPMVSNCPNTMNAEEQISIAICLRVF